MREGIAPLSRAEGKREREIKRERAEREKRERIKERNRRCGLFKKPERLEVSVGAIEATF